MVAARAPKWHPWALVRERPRETGERHGGQRRAAAVRRQQVARARGVGARELPEGAGDPPRQEGPGEGGRDDG